MGNQLVERGEVVLARVAKQLCIRLLADANVQTKDAAAIEV